MTTRKELAFLRFAKQQDARINAVKLSRDDLIDITSDLLEDLDTPTSLGLWIALKAGDIKTVILHEIDPLAYLDWEVDKFRRSYQAISLIRKMAFPVEGLDPLATAHTAFAQSESQCLEANRTLRKHRSDPLKTDPRIHAIFHYMIRDIAATLGGFSPSTWAYACQFGPGAAAGAPGSSAYDKLRAAPYVTKEFALLGAALVKTSPAWVAAITSESNDFSEDKILLREIEEDDIVIAQGGKYNQVPKSAKTNRNIEVQPNLNVYAQAGLGRMIRQRLKLAGLDLPKQEPRNKAAAQRGSITGDLATIDLKAASDSICTELIEELIPPRWLHALKICRTSVACGTLKGDVFLQKFSSMGNGYTFELESLIFWALIRACRRILGDTNEYHIYGDDIVCSTPVAKLAIEAFPALGFTINSEKSFLSGVFRESCGGDYFNGTNVRPYFYKKGDNNSDLQAIVSLANGLRRAAGRCNNHLGCCSRFKRAWFNCLRRVPRDIRRLLMGPWSDEDRWFISDTDEWLDNPWVFLDRETWSRKGPSLLKRSSDKSISSYHAAKAHMLYQLERASLTWEGDELAFVMSRYAREASIFSVPREHSVRQQLDVTHFELSPALHLWM